MIDSFEAVNRNDENGNPAGGSVHGEGLEIIWQDGPLGRGADRKAPNGAFVETVIAAVMQRIDYYQSSKFACEPNRIANEYLAAALARLQARTADREARDVEGTHAA